MYIIITYLSKMTFCYPAIILFILGIVIIYLPYNSAFWSAGIIFGLPFIVFAIISFVLCKKGYNKLAWLSLLGAFTFDMLIVKGVIPINLISYFFNFEST